MCRRGSDVAAPGSVVVALAPRAPLKPATATTMMMTAKPTRSLTFAAAAASADVAHGAAPFGVDESPESRSLRTRVQRLLVQFVMLPVVWVSLCCVITAAMGIEAMESIQKALVHDEHGDAADGDDEGGPTKKPKRTLLDDDNKRRTTSRRETLTDDDAGRLDKPTTTLPPSTAAIVTKSTPNPKARLHQHLPVEAPDAPAVPPPTVRASRRHPHRRRRRVLIWDLDETLVLFASLYSGQFARTHGSDLATSVALGEQMTTYLLAVLERHFFFSDLHDADIDHISCAETDMSPRARAHADRYARIRAIYERRCVDFLDDPTSQWFTARHALVASIDMLSAGWIREALELLALTAAGDDDVVNVLVTNTQLSPALCKCLIYGLDAHFPIECVYSSSKLRKLRCFQSVVATYAAGADDDVDVEFAAIGDGPEEEQASHALGIPFFQIRSLADLRELRYKLALVEAPAAAPTPVRVPSPPPAATTATGTTVCVATMNP